MGLERHLRTRLPGGGTGPGRRGTLAGGKQTVQETGTPSVELGAPALPTAEEVTPRSESLWRWRRKTPQERRPARATAPSSPWSGVDWLPAGCGESCSSSRCHSWQTLWRATAWEYNLASWPPIALSGTLIPRDPARNRLRTCYCASGCWSRLPRRLRGLVCIRTP